MTAANAIQTPYRGTATTASATPRARLAAASTAPPPAPAPAPAPPPQTTTSAPGPQARIPKLPGDEKGLEAYLHSKGLNKNVYLALKACTIATLRICDNTY